MDDNGHGTHTSGTIGALTGNGLGVAGANWDVQIMPLKFTDATGAGTPALECYPFSSRTQAHNPVVSPVL